MNKSIDHAYHSVLPIWASIASGTLAGSIPVLVSNVPETLKTRMQLDGEVTRTGYRTQRQYVNVIDALKKTVKFDGLRGLHAGLGAALIHQAILDGLRLGLFEPIRTKLQQLTGLGNNNFPVKIVSGALAGQIGIIAASPL
jgi:solute carrier family 25 protein 34/35